LITITSEFSGPISKLLNEKKYKPTEDDFENIKSNLFPKKKVKINHEDFLKIVCENRCLSIIKIKEVYNNLHPLEPIGRYEVITLLKLYSLTKNKTKVKNKFNLTRHSNNYKFIFIKLLIELLRNNKKIIFCDESPLQTNHNLRCWVNNLII
jgi:hypothetical protein